MSSFWKKSYFYLQTKEMNLGMSYSDPRMKILKQEKEVFRTLAVMVGAFTFGLLPIFIVGLYVLATTE